MGRAGHRGPADHGDGEGAGDHQERARSAPQVQIFGEEDHPPERHEHDLRVADGHRAAGRLEAQAAREIDLADLRTDTDTEQQEPLPSLRPDEARRERQRRGHGDHGEVEDDDERVLGLARLAHRHVGAGAEHGAEEHDTQAQRIDLRRSASEQEGRPRDQYHTGKTHQDGPEHAARESLTEQQRGKHRRPERVGEMQDGRLGDGQPRQGEVETAHRREAEQPPQDEDPAAPAPRPYARTPDQPVAEHEAHEPARQHDLLAGQAAARCLHLQAHEAEEEGAGEHVAHTRGHEAPRAGRGGADHVPNVSAARFPGRCFADSAGALTAPSVCPCRCARARLSLVRSTA